MTKIKNDKEFLSYIAKAGNTYTNSHYTFDDFKVGDKVVINPCIEAGWITYKHLEETKSLYINELMVSQARNGELLIITETDNSGRFVMNNRFVYVSEMIIKIEKDME